MRKTSVVHRAMYCTATAVIIVLSSCSLSKYNLSCVTVDSRFQDKDREAYSAVVADSSGDYVVFIAETRVLVVSATRSDEPEEIKLPDSLQALAVYAGVTPATVYIVLSDGCRYLCDLKKLDCKIDSKRILPEKTLLFSHAGCGSQFVISNDEKTQIAV